MYLVLEISTLTLSMIFLFGVETVPIVIFLFSILLSFAKNRRNKKKLNADIFTSFSSNAEMFVVFYFC